MQKEQLKTPSKLLDDRGKSILKTPSRAVSRPDALEGGEETEIAAQISIPEEGGWGWVVVMASFYCAFVLDGVVYSFGSLLSDMTTQLQVSDSHVLLTNSVAMAMYFCCGPFASALINRFGFRACVMAGSVTCAFCLFLCHFVSSFVLLVVFYGVFAGFGYCLINMSACLVVGFYFERRRSLAISLATSGSSAGLMAIFNLNTYLVRLAGWQTVTLLHSSMFGTIYFAGMAYRPLLSVTVIKTTDDPTRTVTYLPSLSKAAVPAGSKSKTEVMKPTATERLFSAVTNANFPTAAAVVTDETVDGQAGPSTALASKLTLTAPQGVSRRHIKQVQSLVSKASASKASVQDKKIVEVVINVDERSKKQSCWGRLCHWERHVPHSRPLYRDDAFYAGKVEKLPVYQKSMMDTTPETKTGLEYQLAVSRAVTTGDLQERRGVFTTAARRVLATMMDPVLLKKPSFIALCVNGFLLNMGFAVPYMYTTPRALSVGMEENLANLLMTILALSNALGRLVIGPVADKVDPVKIYTVSCFIAGLITMLSSVSLNIYFQFVCVIVFGFFGITLSFLRSMVIVSMFGLEKLTNGTGMLLLFSGLGSLISTPLAGYLKDNYGFTTAFYVCGSFMLISSLVAVIMLRVFMKEKLKETAAKKSTKKNNK